MPTDEAVDIEEFEEVSKTERLRRQRDEWKREHDRLLKSYEKLEQKCDVLAALDAVSANPPKWLTPVGKRTDKHAIANTVSSDQHFGEVVNPAEIGGVNAYNHRIATMRFQRHMETFISLGKNNLGYLKYDGAHIWWNGDGFSGSIHPELEATNEGSVYSSFDHFLDYVVAGFKLVADEYGRLHVSVRRGNHTRTKPKTPAKGRVRDSLDWLFMRVVAREFKGDPRVTFDIPESDDGIICQYNTRFLATHGDQFKGGSGISGILTPLSLGNYRKSRRQVSIDQPYDVMILGHFHSYMTIPGIIVNGSLKGYDEYAYVGNMGYEPPRQAFWVTTPEHGPAFHVAIEPADRKREGW